MFITPNLEIVSIGVDYSLIYAEHGKKIVFGKINYCPMCGRALPAKGE